MTLFKINKGEWMDEISGAEPVPALEHVYVLLAMELGPPDLSWMLFGIASEGFPNGPMAKISAIRKTFDIRYSTKELLLQFYNWYQQNKPET